MRKLQLISPNKEFDSKEIKIEYPVTKLTDIDFHYIKAKSRSLTGLNNETISDILFNFFEILKSRILNGDTVQIENLGIFTIETINNKPLFKFKPTKRIRKALNKRK